MATYVPEFVILNEIVDFRDICEGSTDDTFVICNIMCRCVFDVCISLFFKNFGLFAS